jgi:hypothetical protein
VVVVVGGAVAGGRAGLARWLPLLEPQADRPNATTVRARMADLARETPAEGPDAATREPTIGAPLDEAPPRESRTYGPYHRASAPDLASDLTPPRAAHSTMLGCRVVECLTSGQRTCAMRIKVPTRQKIDHSTAGISSIVRHDRYQLVHYFQPTLRFRNRGGQLIGMGMARIRQ